MPISVNGFVDVSDYDGSVDTAIKYLGGLSSLLSVVLAVQAGDCIPTPAAGSRDA